MKQRSLLLAAALSTALLAPSAFADVFVGVGVPVVRVPPPAVLVPVVVPRAYVAPVYPVVRVRAGYWPRGVVVGH